MYTNPKFGSSFSKISSNGPFIGTPGSGSVCSRGRFPSRIPVGLLNGFKGGLSVGSSFRGGHDKPSRPCKTLVRSLSAWQGLWDGVDANVLTGAESSSEGTLNKSLSPAPSPESKIESLESVGSLLGLGSNKLNVSAWGLSSAENRFWGSDVATKKLRVIRRGENHGINMIRSSASGL